MNCPCCSNRMLRHIRSRQVHWFCRHCWQEMPNLNMPNYGNPVWLVENLARQQRLLKHPSLTSELGLL